MVTFIVWPIIPRSQVLIWRAKSPPPPKTRCAKTKKKFDMYSNVTTLKEGPTHYVIYIFHGNRFFSNIFSMLCFFFNLIF